MLSIQHTISTAILVIDQSLTYEEALGAFQAIWQTAGLEGEYKAPTFSRPKVILPDDLFSSKIDEQRGQLKLL